MYSSSILDLILAVCRLRIPIGWAGKVKKVFYAKFCTFGKPLGSEQYFVRTRPEHRFNKKWSKLMYLIKTDKKSQFTEHISFISPLLKWVKKCLFSQCSVIKVHVKFQCKWLEMFLRNAEMCKKNASIIHDYTSLCIIMYTA